MVDSRFERGSFSDGFNNEQSNLNLLELSGGANGRFENSGAHGNGGAPLPSGEGTAYGAHGSLSFDNSIYPNEFPGFNSQGNSPGSDFRPTGDDNPQSASNDSGPGKWGAQEHWGRHHHGGCDDRHDHDRDLLLDKVLSDPSLLQTMQGLESDMSRQGFRGLERALGHDLASDPSNSDSALLQQAYQQLSNWGVPSQDLAALQSALNSIQPNGGDAPASPSTGTESPPTTTSNPWGGGGELPPTTTSNPPGGGGELPPTTTTNPSTGTELPPTTASPPGGGEVPPTTPGGSPGTGEQPPIASPAPVTSASGGTPEAPASLNVPTQMVFSDNFQNDSSLNTNVWSPNWFGNGSTQNGTVMDSSNVSVGPNGLNLNLPGNGTGGLVSTNPNDGQPGHTGFEIEPTAGHPVYVQFTATMPETSNGQVANWPALWMVGQQWPQNGEIDVMEGLGGSADYHVHYGSSASDQQGPGGVGETTGGTHTYGALWTTTGVTFVYDGQVVGSENMNVNGPMYLVMENSSGSPSSTPSTMTVQNVSVYQDGSGSTPAG